MSHQSNSERQHVKRTSHSYQPPEDQPNVEKEPEVLQDDDQNVNDYGRKNAYRVKRPPATSGPPRLLLMSSKIKNGLAVQGALLPNVVFILYKYENATLDSLLSCIAKKLGSKKIQSVGYILCTGNKGIQLTGKDDQSVSQESLRSKRKLCEFFDTFVKNHMVQDEVVRMDILACQLANTEEGLAISKELLLLTEAEVEVHKDFVGSKVVSGGSKSINAGELYFQKDRLRGLTGNSHSLDGFEKIRTVGKGAYGTAVLYKKKDDGSLVILKEINLHDLNASERQLALNEVHVLAMLDHPNIISYYDSFELDGVVMIEMEYADGGTLQQFVAQQGKSLEEREILFMFNQMVAALKYIHEHNILHRDLKTANIFLTREGVVKVGDFGISKLMSTSAKGASTVLGTPYYISPEMCEGKAYNHKSDIWALGCILYEMACLQKTFEGSSLPAVVTKIVKGQYAPVKGNYSQKLKDLIINMLQKEPEDRPSAAELWTEKLPVLMASYEDNTSDEELSLSQENNFRNNKKTSGADQRSVLYYLGLAKTDLHPIQLGSRLKIRDVAVGRDHVVVVTSERAVFTWGEGSKGQLGHGNNESLMVPTVVEALKGKSIFRACCGDGFSIFGSDNGLVLTCGDGSSGCLGHGDFQSTTRPRLVEAMLSVDVVQLACGPSHVVAVGSEGDVYSWGNSADGRLGLPGEENRSSPEQVEFREPVFIKDCFCGVDGTMLLTEVGSVLACGNNEYNKLGLNQRQGFLMAMKNIFKSPEVQGEREFTCVRSLTKHRVVGVSMGTCHTAVIVEPGHIYTMGRNSEGQLGVGNTKPQNAPVEVRDFEDHLASSVQCGELYTVAGTIDNELLAWGTRFKHPPKLDESWSSSGTPSGSKVKRSESCPEPSSSSPKRLSHSRQASAASVSSLSSVKEEGAVGKGGQCNPETGEDGKMLRQSSSGAQQPTTTDTTSNGGYRPLSSTPHRTPSISGLNGDKEGGSLCEDADLLLQPTTLLRLDSAGAKSQTGDTVTLSKFYCHGENLFLQVETTAPPPKQKTRRKRYFKQQPRKPSQEGALRMSASSRDGGDEYSSETSELDSRSNRESEFTTSSTLKMENTKTQEIPTWLKQELADAAPIPKKQQKAKAVGKQQQASRVVMQDDTSEHSEDDTAQTLINSLTSLQLTRNLKQASKQRKMELESDTTQIHHPIQEKIPERQKKQRQSSESGIEFTPLDQDSSNSSSEGKAALLKAAEEESKAKAAYAVKRAANTTQTKRKAVVPTPHKSKSGPTDSQKPLSRIRSQGKTRRSDESTYRVQDVDVKQHTQVIDSLQMELEQIREEKRQTEERLKVMKDSLKQQQEQITKETIEKVSEREGSFKEEISFLRRELRQQSDRLQDNNNVMMSLQEELMNFKTEQAKLSARDERPLSRSSNTKESKICLIQ